MQVPHPAAISCVDTKRNNNQAADFASSDGVFVPDCIRTAGFLELNDDRDTVSVSIIER